MIGMDRHTGMRIQGEAHLRQSIGDLLMTPLGSRVMLAGYGSGVPERIDAPTNDSLRIDLAADALAALGFWEPRIRAQSITINNAMPGNLSVSLAATTLSVDGRETGRIQLPGLLEDV